MVGADWEQAAPREAASGGDGNGELYTMLCKRHLGSPTRILHITRVQNQANNLRPGLRDVQRDPETHADGCRSCLCAPAGAGKEPLQGETPCTMVPFIIMV